MTKTSLSASSGSVINSLVPAHHEADDGESLNERGVSTGLLSPEEGEGEAVIPSSSQRKTVSPAPGVVCLFLLVSAVMSVIAFHMMATLSMKAYHTSESSPLPQLLPLDYAESQAVLLLTGREVKADLPVGAVTALRAALHSVAIGLLRTRPALQSLLWRGHCRSFLPCPYPALSSLQSSTSNSTIQCSDDDAVVDGIATRPTAADWWSPPASSTSPLLSINVTDVFSAEVNSAGGRYAPGEPPSSQWLAQEFQVLLYNGQHPIDCSTALYLMFDHLQHESGFGMWQHVRGIHLLYAVRMGRVLVEQVNVISYPLAYSDCTRRHGLGGCDMFLNNTQCTPPEHWQQQMEEEKAQYGTLYGAFSGDWADWGQRSEYLRHRRYVMFDEVVIGDRYEITHGNRPPYTCADFTWEVQHGHYLRGFALMPDCWWYGQVLMYNMRMTVPAQTRLLEELARTLKLPDPSGTAQRVIDYAAGHASSIDHTDFWWLAIQSLKWEWQLQTVAPQLVAALQGWTSSLNATSASTVQPSIAPTRPPLLGYTFIRHGDKGTEAPLHADAEYLELMRHVQAMTGLASWYVGADDLLSADIIRAAVVNRSLPLIVYSSSLVDAIPDRVNHRFSHGFSVSPAKEVSDAEREAIVRRTVLDMAMGQLADVHLSTWTSNHPRMVYKLAQTLSDTRQGLPFMAIDAGYKRDESTNMHLQQKRRHVAGCGD